MCFISTLESGMRNPGAGAGHTSGTMFFLLPSKTWSFYGMRFISTLESGVPPHRWAPRKWDAQPRGGLDTSPVRCYFPLPLKTSSFYEMCFMSTLENVESSRGVFFLLSKTSYPLVLVGTVAGRYRLTGGRRFQGGGRFEKTSCLRGWSVRDPVPDGWSWTAGSGGNGGGAVPFHRRAAIHVGGRLEKTSCLRG